MLIVGLIVVLAIGVVVGFYYQEYLDGLAAGAVALVVLLAVWGLVAGPISAYNRNSCRRIAEGYGLEYDWSIRSDCRLRLPTGQLVPEGKVRITSDGRILTGDS
jgi:hypothetical protein